MIDEELWNRMSDPTPAVLSDAERLRELYAVMRRIAFSRDKVIGNRPLAGGIEEFARHLLSRHQVGEEGPKFHTCPQCGKPLDAPCPAHVEGQPLPQPKEPVPEKVAGFISSSVWG